MLASFLIMIREGLEAALIVAIIAAYLRKTERRDLLKPMWIGVALAVALSMAAGVVLHAIGQELPSDKRELMEASIGFLAVGVLTWMIFWMRKAGASIKGELEAKIDGALAQSGRAVAKTLVFMAFFAVVREGFESALFLLATFDQSGASAGIGALAGTAVAAALGYGLYRGSVRLDLRRFFTLTGGVIIVFAAGLLAGSVHQLWEAGIWNLGMDTAWNTTAFASENSILGKVLGGLIGYRPKPTVGEVVVYWAYLLPVAFFFFFRGSRTSAKAPAASTTATATAGAVAAEPAAVR